MGHRCDYPYQIDFHNNSKWVRTLHRRLLDSQMELWISGYSSVRHTGAELRYDLSVIIKTKHMLAKGAISLYPDSVQVLYGGIGMGKQNLHSDLSFQSSADKTEHLLEYSCNLYEFAKIFDTTHTKTPYLISIVLDKFIWYDTAYVHIDTVYATDRKLTKEASGN